MLFNHELQGLSGKKNIESLCLMIVGLALDRFLRWRWLHVHVNARAVNILFVNIERIHDDLEFL